jgi:hypothetical protein
MGGVSRPPARGRALPPWVPHLLALLGYFALAVLVSWPTILYFDSRITGNLIPDRDQNLWNLWWLKEALVVRHTNPFHTDLLYYPTGVDLYLHDLALPNGLIGLIPQLLWGLLASYNTIVLACYTLTGYAAYRLVLYCLGRRDPAGPPAPQGALRHLAAFLGGVIFALTPYSLDALKQLNILALEWVPLAAEAWLRAWDRRSRGWAAAAAVFLVCAMLVNSYYEILLVLFMAGYVVYTLFVPLPAVEGAPAPPGRARLVAAARRLLYLAPGYLVPAVLLGGPYAWGAWRSTQTQRVTAEATGQQSIHAADLVSFFLPPPDHPWFGSNAPWWQGLDPEQVPGYLGLGLVALALALFGVWTIRRRRDAGFWTIVAVVAAIFAMGTTLRIAGHDTFAGLSIPLPFALIGNLPIFNLIGKVERFEILTLMAMGVFGGWGCAILLARVAALPRPRGAVAAGALSLILLAALLVELPIYPRSDRRITFPPGVDYLTHAPDPGPILELPFVAVRVAPLAKRMLYQTQHQRPILAGYISRTVENRNALPCSPLYRFARPMDLGDADIVSPTTNAQPLAVVHSYHISYIVSYYRYDVETGPFVAESERDAIQALLGAVADGPPVFRDDFMAIYRPKPGPSLTGPTLQIGEGWHALEAVSGQNFRWIDGATATLCVNTPAPAQFALTARATSFGQGRTLEVWQDSTRVYQAPVPTGDVAALQTPVLHFPAGTTALRLVVPEGSSPASAGGAGADTRSLSIGFLDIHIVP